MRYKLAAFAASGALAGVAGNLIMTDARVRAPEGLLPGKPLVLATVRGGAYGPGTPKHGWDYNTPYLRRMLGELWGADLTVVERELTLANDFLEHALAKTGVWPSAKR